MAQDQQWRSLTFLHWKLSPESMRAKVPSWMELDAFEGDAWVGLVPFTMPKVQVMGFHFPTASAFHEINVRTYVTVGGRKGVYFFSLDAESLLAVIGARMFYGLPYVWASMQLTQSGNRIHYKSRRHLDPTASLDIEMEQTGPRAPAVANTLDHFLVERYWLFSECPIGGRFAGEVVHIPYEIASARVLSMEQTLTTKAGFNVTGRAPDHVCVSEGVDVNVKPLIKP